MAALRAKSWMELYSSIRISLPFDVYLSCAALKASGTVVPSLAAKMVGVLDLPPELIERVMLLLERAQDR